MCLTWPFPDFCPTGVKLAIKARLHTHTHTAVELYTNGDRLGTSIYIFFSFSSNSNPQNSLYTRPSIHNNPYNGHYTHPSIHPSIHHSNPQNRYYTHPSIHPLQSLSSHRTHPSIHPLQYVKKNIIFMKLLSEPIITRLKHPPSTQPSYIHFT